MSRCVDYRIRLSGHDDIKELVFATSKYGIKGYIEGNHSMVSASSLLGLFSLDLTKPHILSITRSEKSDIHGFETEMRDIGIDIAVI